MSCAAENSSVFRCALNESGDGSRTFSNWRVETEFQTAGAVIGLLNAMYWKLIVTDRPTQVFTYVKERRCSIIVTISLYGKMQMVVF